MHCEKMISNLAKDMFLGDKMDEEKKTRFDDNSDKRKMLFEDKTDKRRMLFNNKIKEEKERFFESNMNEENKMSFGNEADRKRMLYEDKTDEDNCLFWKKSSQPVTPTDNEEDEDEEESQDGSSQEEFDNNEYGAGKRTESLREFKMTRSRTRNCTIYNTNNTDKFPSSELGDNKPGKKKYQESVPRDLCLSEKDWEIAVDQDRKYFLNFKSPYFTVSERIRIIEAALEDIRQRYVHVKEEYQRFNRKCSRFRRRKRLRGSL